MEMTLFTRNGPIRQIKAMQSNADWCRPKEDDWKAITLYSSFSVI